MSEADFFRDEAKLSTARVIARVEGLTSAELLVAVRRRSGDYRAAAYHFGLLVAGGLVAGLLLVPRAFSVGAISLDALLAFVVGAVLAWNVSPLLRLMLRRSTLVKCVEDAARVAFFDLGVSRTKGRTGVLVYVSTFEQRCAVLTDVGIAVEALEPGFSRCRAELCRAVERRSVAELERALLELGACLAERMPREHDDQNELPDEVH